MQKHLIYHFLSDDDLLRISHRIKDVEKATAGEICVNIKEHLSFFKKQKTIRELAEIEFSKLGLYKTQDKTAVLLFLILEKRQFYILADSGINEKVPENTWDVIKEEMQKMFINGDFSNGILYGIDNIGKILVEHFPIKPDDKNEISDRVIIE
jgi:uncharacterized membrane protein